MKKSKDFKYAVIVFVACLVLMLASMMACNPYGYDIWTEENPNPILNDTSGDANDTIPTDTLPLVVDTCTSYQELVNTKFSTWAINLDGVTPSGYQFYYRINGAQFIPINIDTALSTYGASVTYYSGINICGFVSGYAPQSSVITNIYIFDLFGNIFNLVLRPYDFDMQGALTPDQFYGELVKHSNFKRLGFWNTVFTCDEYNTILDYLIDNCIDGTGNIIDLRHCICPISSERIARLELAGFTVLA